jgi:hypothetical protein
VFEYTFAPEDISETDTLFTAIDPEFTTLQNTVEVLIELSTLPEAIISINSRSFEARFIPPNISEGL